jgi:HSP20 family protein
MRNGWLVRRESPVGVLHGDADRLFDEVFGAFVPEFRQRSKAWAPSLDVSENEDAITVRAEIPGVNPDDFEISIAEDVLTISGEKKEESEEQKGNVYRSERRFGSFSRSVLLSENVDREKVSAEYENGVLTVRLAKSEKAQPKKILVELKK